MNKNCHLREGSPRRKVNMSTVVSSSRVDVLLQVAVVLHGFAATGQSSTFNSGVRSPTSEQIYTSAPNHSSWSKDNCGFDEALVFKSGGTSDLYLDYLAKGLFCEVNITQWGLGFLGRKTLHHKSFCQSPKTTRTSRN